MTPHIIWDWPETAIELGVLVVLALVIYRVINHAIKVVVRASVNRAEARLASADSRTARILAGVTGISNARHRARTETLGSMLRSVNAVVVLVITIMLVLRVLGIPLTPLIASAGIGGVALGFGAQSLVKDYLSGIFMILEDQFGVGDVVDLGEVKGTIEEVGLRVTRLRDMTGQVWYVRNGEILRVGNLSQGWSTATVVVPVAVTSDPVQVLEVLGRTMAEVYADPEFDDVLLEEPSVAGIDAVDGGAMNAKIFAKCAPNKHWGIQREILERSMVALREAGIKAPLLASTYLPAMPSVPPEATGAQPPTGAPLPDAASLQGPADAAPTDPPGATGTMPPNAPR
ncbi:mechanosensitive ion channel family protein [Granulicoccus sp. GXG6511]|uniref:mechanosensitive ion channel family protein n=1 Tax=Granulicoccus sp. GXG6511 TaxID=3381351 RepID=UPI003D7E5428